MKKGFLALIGGAEDKRYDKVVLKTVLGLNNAKNVVVVPSASRYGVELGMEYVSLFKNLGCTAALTTDIKNKSEAAEKKYFEAIQQADMIFFTGGDQVKLTEIFNHTELLALIRHRHENEGLTIAGTSAGAAAASEVILFDGDDFGFQKGAVNAGIGFGWLKGITIDTHFMERNRIPRLMQFLVGYPAKLGIGISENTAIMIYPNQECEVVGSGAVVLMDAREVNFTNYAQIKNNEVISLSNIKMSFLSHGIWFDLKNWRIIENKLTLLPNSVSNV